VRPEYGDIVANDDVVITDKNTPVDVYPLDNDFGVEGYPLVVSRATFPGENGECVVINDETVMYIPQPDFVGDDACGYEACDDREKCDVATIMIFVNGTAEPCNEDKSATAEPTGSITGSPVSTPVETPSPIAVEIPADTPSPTDVEIAKTPAPAGVDTKEPCPDDPDIDVNLYNPTESPTDEPTDKPTPFPSVKLTDEPTKKPVFNWTLDTLAPTNDEPTNEPTSVTTCQDTLLSKDVVANDQLKPKYLARIETNGDNGLCVAESDGKTFIYYPNAGFVGKDYCEYVMCVGTGECAVERIDILVNAPGTEECPTNEPTLEPTPEPTPSPSKEPTDEPTPELTPSPSKEPTDEPTPVPSDKPTGRPSPVQTDARITPAPQVVNIPQDTLEPTVIVDTPQPTLIATMKIFTSPPTPFPLIPTDTPAPSANTGPINPDGKEVKPPTTNAPSWGGTPTVGTDITAPPVKRRPGLRRKH